MAESENQYFPQSRPHPGETLKEKLDEMRMGPKEFAHLTGTPENIIIAIIKEKSPITPDMAVQFENVTKIQATFWMNHQKGYDEYIASKPPKRKIGILEDKGKVDFKDNFTMNEEDMI